MEPNMFPEEVNVEPTANNRSPGAEETPGRMGALPKSITHSTLSTSTSRPLTSIVWDRTKPHGDGEEAQGNEATAGGDGLSSDSSTSAESPTNMEPPVGAKHEPPAPPDKAAVLNVDAYKTEEEIVARMKELRKRYSESLSHVRRLRRSLGSLSPTPDDLDRRMESSGWNTDITTRSRGSDDMDDDVFEQPSNRPRVKSLKRPEDVAQEKGIATASLFSTKPSTDEITIDENGYKSYQCLLCSRTFTHPPAFSQHKRAHGREAAVSARS
eukprot:m.103556 g.103556  ORF g.103556 m.103556 type:complete len:269 (-) comp10483_c0_seq4:263-1069(-)